MRTLLFLLLILTVGCGGSEPGLVQASQSADARAAYRVLGVARTEDAVANSTVRVLDSRTGQTLAEGQTTATGTFALDLPSKLGPWRVVVRQLLPTGPVDWMADGTEGVVHVNASVQIEPTATGPMAIRVVGAPKQEQVVISAALIAPDGTTALTGNVNLNVVVNP